MSNFNRKKVGVFKINLALLENSPEAVISILSGLIVLRCELMAVDDCLEYIAIGPQFETLKEGQLLLFYDCFMIEGQPVFIRNNTKTRWI